MLAPWNEEQGTAVTRSPDLAMSAQFARLNHWEAGVCRRCNRLAHVSAVRRYFSIVSRLGDGIAWYALLAILPVANGPEAVAPAVHMAATALVGVGIYKLIKNALGRERPCAAIRAVRALVPPLDLYSFPSGHTMHAAAFTVMLAHYFPELLIVVVPFAASVALSRVVLGLHYPTDVLAGAGLGILIARSSLMLWPL
jgi:undecaprenyl-diphosphatase